MQRLRGWSSLGKWEHPWCVQETGEKCGKSGVTKEEKENMKSER